MPKIIPGLREQILQNGKELLLDQKKALTMRGIAVSCGIAPGTIYNYFPNREALIAAILTDDWHASAAQMKESAENAPSFAEGIRGMYDALCVFTARYKDLWASYAGRGKYLSTQDERHENLIRDLRSFTGPLLKRFGTEEDLVLERILTETILSASLHPAVTWEELRALCGKIIKENT